MKFARYKTCSFSSSLASAWSITCTSHKDSTYANKLISTGGFIQALAADGTFPTSGTSTLSGWFLARFWPGSTGILTRNSPGCESWWEPVAISTGHFSESVLSCRVSEPGCALLPASCLGRGSETFSVPVQAQPIPLGLLFTFSSPCARRAGRMPSRWHSTMFTLKSPSLITWPISGGAGWWVRAAHAQRDPAARWLLLACPGKAMLSLDMHFEESE